MRVVGEEVDQVRVRISRSWERSVRYYRRGLEKDMDYVLSKDGEGV